MVIKTVDHSTNFNKMSELSKVTAALMRAPEQSIESIKILEALGLKTVLIPAIKVIPPPSFDEFDKQIKELDTFNYLILTSVNAVRSMVERVKYLGLSLTFSKVKVLAIGPRTSQACLEAEIPVHIIPVEFSAKGAIDKLMTQNIAGKKFFIPGSYISRDDLAENLVKIGGKVVKCAVYDIGLPSDEECAKYIDLLKETNPNLFIFTSPSTYKNFIKMCGIKNPAEYFEGKVISAIGPTTASELIKAGIVPGIIPKDYSMQGIANSILEFYGQSNNKVSENN